MAFAAAGVTTLTVSVLRKSAGVAGQREARERRSARVAAMTGISRADEASEVEAREFPPVLDLLTAVVGLIAVLIASLTAGGPPALSLYRGLISALFLGSLTDAMLLGHWYLVQPGLARKPVLDLIRWTGVVWVFETVAMVLPTGMLSVLNGTIDDAYNGLLGWFWAACVVTTISLVVMARATLKERSYSAVMAATGLVYLAILSGFGQDLVPRVLLTP